MMRISRSLALGTILLSLGACATRKALILSEPFPTLRNLAVLPPENQSVDLDAPGIVRKELEDELIRKGYSLVAASKVDEVLKRDFAVTDGGQLGAADPGKLAQALGADGILYATIEQFLAKNIGFYLENKVATRCRIVEGATGKVVWEDKARYSEKDIAFKKEEAGQKLLQGVVRKTFEKATKSHLVLESRVMARRLFKLLPNPR